MMKKTKTKMKTKTKTKMTMKMSARRGFILYLAFLVTSMLFFLIIGGQDVARLALDLSRSTVLELTGFQAADGGLERGLAHLRKTFTPFTLSYEFPLSRHRVVRVEVAGRTAGPSPERAPWRVFRVDPSLDLIATATILEGERTVSFRCLERRGVQKRPGRIGTGRFLEAS